MRIATETSYHDAREDDEKAFGENYELIYGKAWYEREEPADDSE